MFRRSFLGSLSLVSVGLLAGCLGGGRRGPVDAPSPTPGPDTTRLSVLLRNDAPFPLLFTTAVVTGDLAGVTVEYRDRSTEPFPDADSLAAVPQSAWTDAVSFQVGAADAEYRRTSLVPGSAIGSGYPAVARGASVVYMVADEDGDRGVLALGASVCRDAALVEQAVQVDAGGQVRVDTTCSDTGFGGD